MSLLTIQPVSLLDRADDGDIQWFLGSVISILLMESRNKRWLFMGVTDFGTDTARKIHSLTIGELTKRDLEVDILMICGFIRSGLMIPTLAKHSNRTTVSRTNVTSHNRLMIAFRKMGIETTSRAMLQLPRAVMGNEVSLILPISLSSLIIIRCYEFLISTLFFF